MCKETFDEKKYNDAVAMLAKQIVANAEQFAADSNIEIDVTDMIWDLKEEADKAVEDRINILT